MNDIAGDKEPKSNRLSQEENEHFKNKKGKSRHQKQLLSSFSSSGEQTEGFQSMQTTMANSVQSGQEHALIRIISCMYRQQANMSIEHARQIEMLIQHHQNHDSISVPTVRMMSNSHGVHSMLQDLNLSRGVTSVESLEEKKYREELLKLASLSLDGIQKINETLDKISKLDEVLENNDNNLYDALGLSVEERKRSINHHVYSSVDIPNAPQTMVTSFQHYNSDGEKGESDDQAVTRNSNLKRSRTDSESSEYSGILAESTSPKRCKLRSGVTVDGLFRL